MKNILTQDDIKFLKELAIELKTQDRVYTAKPVIYQIREEEIITGIDINYADEICLVDTYDEVKIYKEEDINQLKEHFNDYWQDEEKYQKTLKQINNADSLEEIYEILEINDLDEFWELTGYIKQHKYSNFFLTKKALDKHVQQNHYHYKNPNYFVSHAWRNLELQRLLDIVEKFADVEVE